jgi:phosphosulfolactate synthase (CoM biosynthesis protein A)
MTTIINAILAINPNAQVGLADEDVNQITWQNGTTPIAKEDILAKQVELQAEYDAKQYQRDRAEEYPTWQDQLDDIYHNGIDAWKATIKATKDKYPK